MWLFCNQCRWRHLVAKFARQLKFRSQFMSPLRFWWCFLMWWFLFCCQIIPRTKLSIPPNDWCHSQVSYRSPTPSSLTHSKTRPELSHQLKISCFQCIPLQILSNLVTMVGASPAKRMIQDPMYSSPSTVQNQDDECHLRGNFPNKSLVATCSASRLINWQRRPFYLSLAIPSNQHKIQLTRISLKRGRILPSPHDPILYSWLVCAGTVLER